MADEKRIISGYTEQACFRLGEQEVILAEDPKAELPFLVCTCTWDNPFGADVYRDGMGCDDYLEAVGVFLERLEAQREALVQERQERGVPLEALTTADCIPGSLGKDLTGQVIILNPEAMVPEARTADHQLGIATGGFGCSSTGRGQSVYVQNLYTGEKSRWSRSEIMGVIRPDRLPEWAVEKLQERRGQEKQTSIKGKLETAKAARPPAQGGQGREAHKGDGAR